MKSLEKSTLILVKRRRRLMWGLGCLFVMMAAAVWVLPDKEGAGVPFDFQVVMIKQANQGATNVAVFRVTSYEEKEFVLPDPGSIRVPSASASGYNPILGKWSLKPVSPAKCITNFVPINFSKDVEFAIVVPTNQVWRLDVQPIREVKFIEAVERRLKKTCGKLKHGEVLAIPRIWSGPYNNVWENYFVWSPPITNTLPPD